MGTLIKKLTKDDLNGIVSCHMTCFPKTFLTSLGKKIIHDYYETCLNKTSDYCFGAFDNSVLVGFVYGYLKDGSKSPATQFSKENRIRILFVMLWKCLLFNGVVYRKIFSILFSKRSPKTTHSNDVIYGDLLSICVVPEHHGDGTSSSLLRAYEQSLLEKNIASYKLTVNKNNYGALKFYKKNMLEITSETKGGFVLSKNIK